MAARNSFLFPLMILASVTLAVAVTPPLWAASPPAATAALPLLPGPGKKVPLGDGCYFTFSFDRTPKIGVCIVRVEVFGPDGKRDTSFLVKGDADMPSMRGAHSTGDRDFSLSNLGVYLLPVRLVMPGDWEIKLTFLKKGKAVYRGAYLFDL